MAGVQEKTEVVVEEFDVEEVEAPVETNPIEEVKSDGIQDKELKGKSNRELVEEAARQVEKEAKDGNKDEDSAEEVEEPKKDDFKEPSKGKDRLEGKQQNLGIKEKEILKAPQRFSAKEKEIFNKAPTELKSALHKMVTNMEGQFTRTQQEYKAAIGHASELLEVVKPFAANLAEQGFSVPKGVAQLLGVQAKLTNPQTKDDTYIRIGLDIKPSLEAYKKLGQHLGYSSESSEEGGSSVNDISAHPTVKQLKDEIKGLRELINPIHNEREEQSQRVVKEMASDIRADLETVRDETDDSGTYLYPRLHDDHQFIEKWKPLVSAYVRAIEGLSYADAARRAYRELDSGTSKNSGQTLQNKLPRNENINERARVAASSVRGRSAPPSNGFQVPDKIPRNNRDLVRLAHELASRDN